VDHDGHADVITAPGPSGGPDIRVFSGLDAHILQEFGAYDAGYSAGVFVAAGDINGDGTADIVTGTDVGPAAGGNVRAFSGVNDSQIANFLAYPSGFGGGVRVAVVPDLGGGNRADIVTGAGPGGGPQLLVFDGLTQTILDSFFAYNASFSGGIYVGGN
jgi:serralysin